MSLEFDLLEVRRRARIRRRKLEHAVLVIFSWILGGALLAVACAALFLASKTIFS